jgi:hypothetical protein
VPILIPDSRRRFSTIGGTAAIIVLALIALLVRFSSWRLPARTDREWEILTDVEFPQIAERVFRKIEVQHISIEHPELSNEPSGRTMRSESVAKLVTREEHIRNERFDERSGVRASTVVTPTRSAALGERSDFSIPRGGGNVSAPMDVTREEAVSSQGEFYAHPEVGSVERKTDIEPHHRETDKATGHASTSALLEWMRQHPATFSPQVETFLLAGASGAELLSQSKIDHGGKPYSLYLAAIVETDEQAYSEIRVGVLDLQTQEIAQLVDFGRFERTHSHKVGTVRLSRGGEVVWIDARQRVSSDARWGEIFSQWLERVL